MTHILPIISPIDESDTDQLQQQQQQQKLSFFRIEHFSIEFSVGAIDQSSLKRTKQTEIVQVTFEEEIIKKSQIAFMPPNRCRRQ